MVFNVFALTALIAHPHTLACTAPIERHAELQWSEPTKVSSPNRRWELESRPVLDSPENNTLVTVRECGDAKRYILLSIHRSANIYWDDKDRLLFINADNPDSYIISLFSLVHQKTIIPVDDKRIIDTNIKTLIKERSGSSEQIAFYLPTFVSWGKSSLVLKVGGTMSSGDDGPMSSFCYKVTVNINKLNIKRFEHEPIDDDSNNCRIFP